MTLKNPLLVQRHEEAAQRVRLFEHQTCMAVQLGLMDRAIALAEKAKLARRALNDLIEAN